MGSSRTQKRRTGRDYLAPALNVTCVGASVGLLVFVGLLALDGPGETEVDPGSERDATSTTGVTVEELDPDLVLFLDALGLEAKPLSLGLNSMMSGVVDADSPENEAPLLGAWWAFADWCAEERRFGTGECYDRAIAPIEFWFERDPREINAETWFGAGAIAGTVNNAYNQAAEAIGLSPHQDTIDGLMAGRPGITVRCEPSCAEVLDG